MKKVIAIFAIAALTACGGSTEQAAQDSTKVDSVKIDSVKVDGVAVDPTPVVDGGTSETLGNPTKQLDK